MWLVSLSSGTASNVVVWDVASRSPVTVGTCLDPLPSIQFLSHAPRYRFLTTSTDALCLWDLHLDGLKQSTITIQNCLEKHDFIACCWVHFSGMVVCLLTHCGDLLQYSNGVISLKQEGLSVGTPTACFALGGCLVIGTRQGRLEFFEEVQDDMKWKSKGYIELGSEVLSIQMDPNLRDGLVSTMDSSIWCFSWTERLASRLISGIGERPNSFQLCTTHGQQISLFHGDRTVRLVDLATGELLRHLTFDQDCSCARISSDGSIIISGFFDGSIDINKSANTKRIKIGAHALVKIAISGDKEVIMCVDSEGVVFWIDDDGQVMTSVPLWNDQETPFIDCDISHDLRLGAFTWGHKFIIYQLQSNPIQIFQHLIPNDSKVSPSWSKVSFNKSSRSVVWSSSWNDGFILLIDIQTRSIIKRLHLEHHLMFLAPSMVSEDVFLGSSNHEIFELYFDRNEARQILQQSTNQVLGLASFNHDLYTLHTDHLSKWKGNIF